MNTVVNSESINKINSTISLNVCWKITDVNEASECEAKAEARYHKAEVEAKAKKNFARPRPNSVRPRPEMPH